MQNRLLRPDDQGSDLFEFLERDCWQVPWGDAGGHGGGVDDFINQFGRFIADPDAFQAVEGLIPSGIVALVDDPIVADEPPERIDPSVLVDDLDQGDSTLSHTDSFKKRINFGRSLERATQRVKDAQLVSEIRTERKGLRARREVNILAI